MDRKKQEQQAQQREALLQSKFSPQELKKIQQYNPVQAQSALLSAQLRDSKIQVLANP
jgi:hypothetical protein